MIDVICEENCKACDYEDIARCAFEKLSLVGDAFAELVFMDEDEIHKLNLITRGVDRATDVLSYPNLNEILPFTQENYPFDYDKSIGKVSLGSIVICTSVAERQAEEYGHSTQREMSYLFLHGLLHLLGYDHIEEGDKKIMRSKEEEILSALGVNR